MSHTYTRVPDPNLNPNKPTRSADIKQIRDNQDEFDEGLTALEAGTLHSDQGIYDDFNQADTTPLATNWTTVVNGAGSAVAVNATTGALECTITNGVADRYAGVIGPTTKMRLDKAQEFIAVATFRLKRSTDDNSHYAFGWNDAALSAGNQFSDTTDCILCIRDALGGWTLTVNLGGSGSSVQSSAADAEVYNEIQIRWTGSATAGTRRVSLYTNGTLDGSVTSDSSMPTAVMRPTIGVRGDVTGAGRLLYMDSAKYGFISAPRAA